MSERVADKAPDVELLRASAGMAIGTVVSRVTGFVRTLVLVWALGTALFGDAFNLANSVPNALYILVAGGALNAVFVPQLVRAMTRDPDGGEAFGQRLLTVATLILLAVTVLAVVGAPWLVSLYASSSLAAPENRPYFDLTVTFARYCLPQVLFYGLFVLLGQVLNARGRFGPMMWAPVLNNLVSIAVFTSYIGISGAHTPGEISAGEKALLGIGSTAGIAAQMLVLVPIVARTGFRLRPRFDFRGAGLGKSGRLALWTIGFVVVNQVWFFVSARLTTGAGIAAEQAYGDGVGYGLTPFLHAYTIVQLPHGVIAVSIVSALLPKMSRSASIGDIAAVREDLSQGLRTTAAAVMPAAFAFLALGPWMCVAMFDHFGAMNTESARVIGYVLMGYAVGLVGFCGQYVSLRGFYAFEDTRTPLFTQTVLVATSIALAVVADATLPIRWRTVGVATAYSIACWVGLAVNLAVLRRRWGHVDGRRLLRTHLRVGAASLVAAVVAFGVAVLCALALGDGALGALVAVVVGGVVLLAAYLALAWWTGIEEVTDVLAMVRDVVARARRRRA
ncbi:murein biosynthesis integral membrane protein MurJ [Thermasporomyces composti]|uniref:Putative peptidoglycan lipid II flippase n=1 Tax=Thermasporomyces composti TaxID=696763 RepID=A0A3D9V957_THECX|nr:murein biosynthesis integral membrane protein MurJ [Thermasporomyces composti]REF37826.1 putative peptidoglycan lipid II flippase [Thermasporomyces composti]